MNFSVDVDHEEMAINHKINVAALTKNLRRRERTVGGWL